MEKIGVFGGSFDPCHKEHILVALSSLEELGLDKLYIVPTLIAPHKRDKSAVSGNDRLKMLQIAFKNYPKIIVSDYEIKNEGVSYTYLTLSHFKNLYKNAKLYFIMGSDMLENFPTWKNPEIITSLCKLVLVSRQDKSHLNENAIKTIKEKYNTDVIVLKSEGAKVSSTEIRTRLKLGLSVEEFLDSEVINYISKNNLYAGDNLYNAVNKELPQKRKTHVLGVILTALELGKKLGLDLKKVETASLLHDIAKYKDANCYPSFKLPPNCLSEVAHQFLGEYIAREELGVEDKDVLNAIKYHTTGREDMSLLEKVVYIADLIEPSRKYLGVEDLRKEVSKDFENGFKICIKEVFEFLKKGGGDIYPLTELATKFYCKE